MVTGDPPVRAEAVDAKSGLHRTTECDHGDLHVVGWNHNGPHRTWCLKGRMMAGSHVIDYRIVGDDMQLVEITLDPGETVIADLKTADPGRTYRVG